MKHKWVEGVVFHSLYQKVVGVMKKYERALNWARYNIKIRKLCRKMAECMDEEGVISCAETIAEALRILPISTREGLIDTLLQTIDEIKRKLEG